MNWAAETSPSQGWGVQGRVHQQNDRGRWWCLLEMWVLPGHLGTDGGSASVLLITQGQSDTAVTQRSGGGATSLLRMDRLASNVTPTVLKAEAPRHVLPAGQEALGPSPELKFHRRWRKVSRAVWLLGRAPGRGVTVCKAVRCQHLLFSAGPAKAGLWKASADFLLPPPPASHVFPKIEDLRDFHLSFSVWFSGLSLS